MSEILSKYALPGGEIELKAIGRAQEPEDSRQRKAHRSHVLKVLTENRVEVAMPIEAGKLILLPVDGEYDMYFYGNNVVYQCTARVVDTDCLEILKLLTATIVKLKNNGNAP